MFKSPKARNLLIQTETKEQPKSGKQLMSIWGPVRADRTLRFCLPFPPRPAEEQSGPPVEGQRLQPLPQD